MRYIAIIFTSILCLFLPKGQLIAQENDSATPPSIEIYLITCGAGDEAYSAWGHSALRIVDHNVGTDWVYNWGVFDFNTKHFIWKFARGRLNYMLAVNQYSDFIESYKEENRWVASQQLNLRADEIDKLMVLLQRNLQPENRYYLYDFLYDNCATRIRDIIEDAVGTKLLYPPSSLDNESLSFDEKVHEYVRYMPWLKFGIDLALGKEMNKETSFRSRMFLPDDLSYGFTRMEINYGITTKVPLSNSPITIVDATTDKTTSSIFNSIVFSPISIFALLFVVVLILSLTLKNKKAIRAMDITIFSIYSLLAVMMIFFNFFTDHIETKGNWDIIWLNPFIIVSLFAIIFNKDFSGCFKIVLLLNLCYSAVVLMFPSMDKAILPLALIISTRCLAHTEIRGMPKLL